MTDDDEQREARPERLAMRAIAAFGLAALADWLFYRQWIGSTLGGFALAWAVAIFVTVPGARRSKGALIALLGGVALALAMIDSPNAMQWLLFWTLISTAALLAHRRFDNLLEWGLRLAGQIPLALVQPVLDLQALFRARPIGRGPSVARIVTVAALPVVGGAIFVALFAGANPLIGELFAQVRVPSIEPLVPHLLVLLCVFVALWPSFHPHQWTVGGEIDDVVQINPDARFELPIPVASITLSLLTFNAIFAVQNLLDILFLWSGARLPGTLTLADYAHRGAYLLILTALLAGLFVLVALRPGSATARRPAIRLLVTLWIAQNVLLVASSMLRTIDYVASYSLTELRIAALIWMALVALGLVLVLWRLVFARSAGWLINRNALAALLALGIGSTLDLGAIAAHWNVRHARDAGGSGQPIDLCYLSRMGAPALVSLVELERRATDPELQDRARALRDHVLADVEAAQADWHSWTLRNSRRLAAARAALGPAPIAPLPARWGRGCDGSINHPPETVVEDSASVPPPDGASQSSAPSNELTSGAR